MSLDTLLNALLFSIHQVMANRRGVFLGGYVQPYVRKYVERLASNEQKTVTQKLSDIIIEHQLSKQKKTDKAKECRQ